MSGTMKMKDESEDKLAGFAIAGKDRRFHPADVNWYTDGTKDSQNRLQYKRDILVLSSPFVAEPVAYRYAWARNPIANITNNRQIPIATQRNDDWILEETPVKFPTPQGVLEKDFARQVRGKIMKELELDDIERRIKEAEATSAELKPALEKARAGSEKKKAAEAGKNDKAGAAQ